MFYGRKTRNTRRSTSEISLSLPPSILLLRSMSTRRNGTNSRISKLRHLDLPSLRLLLVLLPSTTNTVVSMLVTGTLTKISLLSLTQSFKSTTEFLLTQSTLLIWMFLRLRATLLKMFQFTLAESVLVVQLMVLAFHLESPKNNVLVLRT